MPGMIGKKVGMTQVFTSDGALVPVTVIQVGPCTVVQKREPEKDGYVALQLGFGSQKLQRLNNPEKGHVAKAAQGAFEVLGEFRWEETSTFEVGQQIKATDLFKEGDRVDVTGTSKGKGFAGVVKKWGFGGFPASHGTHEYFRHAGAIGNRSFPGRVFKGKKMAGHWGNERNSVQNLEVVAIRGEENLVLVKGAVPGPKTGLLMIRPATKEGQKEDQKGGAEKEKHADQKA